MSQTLASILGTATLIALAALPISPPSHAEPLAKPVRIGVLTLGWGPTIGLQSVVKGLVEFGYHNGEDFAIGVRFTSGEYADLPAAAEAMVRGGVDVVLAVGPAEAVAARDATSTKPIVFMNIGDPVGLGLIDSFARPGGNLTGVTDLNLEVSDKRLELFGQIVAGLKRVLFPYDADNPYHVAQAEHYRSAAERLGMTLVEMPLATTAEAAATLSRVGRPDVDGIISPRDTDLDIPGQILELSARESIPTMFDLAHYAEMGGLASYGGASDTIGRQVADLIDQIIKGADPGQIPVQTAVQLELVVNLKFADQIGIAVPHDVLFQSDRILR